MLKMKTLLLSLLILQVLLYSMSAYANEKEYRLKAGFLYNFARFGQWQDTLTQNENFTLCSPSQNFIDVAIVTLKDRSIKNLPIKLRLVLPDKEILEACNMLFITSEMEVSWQDEQLTSYKNIMLVGEAETFIDNGGQIRFFLTGGKIRFEISPQRLSDAGISMSSKVLRLARIVGG